MTVLDVIFLGLLFLNNESEIQMQYSEHETDSPCRYQSLLLRNVQPVCVISDYTNFLNKPCNQQKNVSYIPRHSRSRMEDTRQVISVYNKYLFFNIQQNHIFQVSGRMLNYHSHRTHVKQMEWNVIAKLMSVKKVNIFRILIKTRERFETKNHRHHFFLF